MLYTAPVRRLLTLLAALLAGACVAPDNDLHAGLGAAFGDDGTLVSLGSSGGRDVWLSRIGRDGRRRWQTTFGTDEPEKATDVEVGDDQITVAGVVTTAACERRTPSGFVAQFETDGRHRRTRIARRSGDACRGLAIRRIAAVGERFVALASASSARERELSGVTVFTFDDDGVGEAYEFDGEFSPRALLGHRDGFVVVGLRTAGSRAVSVTAFAPDGTIRWHRGLASDDAAPSIVASNLVDGEVVVAVRPLTGEDTTVTLLRYALDDGTLLWRAGIDATGSPLAVVDGPRKRWGLVTRDVWDFALLGWRADEPEVAVGYTAEGVGHLAFRYGDAGVEIADRGTDNVVRWWTPTEGGACDRHAGLISFPKGVPPAIELARGEPPWIDEEAELVDREVHSSRRAGDVPIEVCGVEPWPGDR